MAPRRRSPMGGAQRYEGGFNWPHPHEGPFHVHHKWAVVAGRVECVSLLIEPLNDETAPQPVTTYLVAQVQRELRTRVRPNAVGTIRQLAGLRSAGSVAKRAKAALPEWEAKPGGAGRPALYGDEHYQEVARLFEQARADDAPPATVIAETYGFSESTARNHIEGARLRGHLPPGRPKKSEAPASDSKKGAPK